MFGECSVIDKACYHYANIPWFKVGELSPNAAEKLVLSLNLHLLIFQLSFIKSQTVSSEEILSKMTQNLDVTNL